MSAGWNRNASRAQIVELMGQGLSNTAIARQLRCDRHRVGDIRRDLDVPNVRSQPLTLEQKWAANARDVGDGHLEWTGPRAKDTGTPVFRYCEEWYSPTAIAFRIQYGREPVGYVYAECGFKHCVAPAHVDDQPGRQRTREQLRYLTGGQTPRERCVRNHDQAVHGRFEADGRAFCAECKRLSKQTPDTKE